MISHEYRTPIKEKLRDLESRYIHEGRVVFDNFADLNYVRSLFHFVEFECLLEINEQIYPRFIIKFYSQYRVSYSEEGQMFVEFVIQNQFFSFSLQEFAQILDIPCEDGQVHRIHHEEEIDVLEYQVLTHEIKPTLKPLEEIIQENFFCLRGNRDHVPACLCYMLYCVVHSERFNLAYFMTKRIEENPELENESYVWYDRVMTPLAAQLERKPKRDRGTRRVRHSTSSSSSFDQPSSSHLNDDDDDGNDEGTSCVSTPSPIRYVNSLSIKVLKSLSKPI
ncbi:hypothetical protein Tco_0856952 [Tanacetum coccineum]|uniref:Uncharacterized protein n=1 Tax=Tanacetum coccineum TaxID=301880 RepID=A0ABQ5B593_9ASTR